MRKNEGVNGCGCAGVTNRAAALRSLAACALLFTPAPPHPFTPSSWSQEPAPLAETTPGLPARLADVVLPGPELEALPAADRKAPLILRVVSVRPHGSAFRYELEFTGLDPGSYDLRTALRRKDGATADALPPLPVRVAALRPPGQVEPHALAPTPVPPLGGYRTLAAVAGVAWGAGLVALLLSFVFPRRKGAVAVVNDTPLSLADRLRPLVESAAVGTAARADLAALERALFSLWRRRLGLESAEPAEALAAMRSHPGAGPLLGQLEAWLHRPATPEPVDVAKLLEPYRNLPPDDADAAGGAA